MAVTIWVKNGLVGADIVDRNLAQAISRIKGFTAGGLELAGQAVLREAMIMTPVDTGNLIKSYEVSRAIQTPQGLKVVIWNFAEYALYVHEVDRNYRKPGSQWKFLETALVKSRDQVLSILKRSAR